MTVDSISCHKLTKHKNVVRLLLHHRLATILVLIAHLALVLALYSEAFVRIDGEAFALLGDDEFISMVYAR